MAPSGSAIKKVVLAYSGGLDTSVILKWLQVNFKCEVVTFTADIGQGEEIESAREKANQMGIQEIYIEDLCDVFASEYIFPMLRANTVYEGTYLLGTAIARPLIAKRLVEIAKEVGADAICHGATGKGNDQVRFELGVHALAPELQVIAPWREWDMHSREALLSFAKQHQIPIDFYQGKRSPFSMDANLLHISYEGGILEDLTQAAPEDLWRWTQSPEQAPGTGEELEITFAKGDAKEINGEALSPAQILQKLNTLGGKHGVGRLDLVENRYIGIKSRGCYETPGGTILLYAHRCLEAFTLDRELAHLKDDLMPRYARLIYNGYWWSPERLALQQLIDYSQNYVNGTIRLKLYKGTISVLSRTSTNNLYDAAIATFEDDQNQYCPQDASGFIHLQGLRLQQAAKKGRRLE